MLSPTGTSGVVHNCSCTTHHVHSAQSPHPSNQIRTLYTLNLRQGLGDVSNQIAGIFDADADPKEIMPVVVVVDKN